MSVRKLKSSWWVDFRYERKRYRKRSPLNTKAGAKDYEALLRQKLSRGENIDEEKRESKELFKKFAWNWFETYVKTNNKHSEIISKESTLRVHLVPFFGKTRLDEIDSRQVEKYKRTKQQTKLSNKSINNHLAIMKKCLETAIEWNILKTAPRIKLLKVPPQTFDYLTVQESKNLLAVSEGNLHNMILLGLQTGMRFGEMIALTWEDIDFERKLISVNKSISKGVLGSTKSNKIRFIPITNTLLDILCTNKKEFGKVFEENNKPLKQVRACKRLDSACKRANLRHIGWHVLRHTFASHLTQKGVPIKAVQELLGHSDVKTTMRYAHLSPHELRTAIDVIDFGQPVGNRPDFKLDFTNHRFHDYSSFSLTQNKKQSF